MDDVETDERTDERFEGSREVLERRVEKDVDRIAFFSDAIFAIAITLLTLKVAIPSGLPDDEVGDALAGNYPEYFSFALSFWVIGSYWMAHHRMFRYVQRYDRLFIRLNLLFMSAIAFLPFPTEVIGEYGQTVSATVLYAACIVVCGLFMTLLWVAADRHRLLVPDLPPQIISYLRWRGIWLMLPFVLSIPVAFFNTSVAKYLWILLFFVRPLEAYMTRDLRKRHGSHL